ncbi:MAG: hypothetical protein ACU0CA_08970 [Paracoccaceae bacterium]
MTDKHYLDDAALEALFEEAANVETVPSKALMTRIVADADQVADVQDVMRNPPRPAARQNWFAGFLQGIGGWPAMGGLLTATMVGIWVGYAPPAALDGIADTYLTTDTGFDLGDLMPSYEALIDEG